MALKQSLAFPFRLYRVFSNMFSIYFNYSKFYISLLKLPSVVVHCVGGTVVVSTITSAFGSAKNSCLLTCWEFRHSSDDILTIFPSELADDGPQVCFGSTHFSRQESSCLSFGLIRSCYPVALAMSMSLVRSRRTSGIE